MSTVLSPAFDAVDAAAMPAGPPPTITSSRPSTVTLMPPRSRRHAHTVTTPHRYSGAGIGSAPSAVLERIRKLEAKGAIREYVACIDPHLANRALLAFVAVKTNEYGPDQPSAKALARISEVLEIHHVAGEDCFLLKVRAKDAEHLGQMLRTQIAAVPGVTSTLSG